MLRMGDIFKDYWISKLLFPKTVIVDKPGIIISKALSKFGRKEDKRRIIFHFEDIIANLQLETIKKLGKNKAGEIFYSLGKDITTRYMLVSDTKKIPSFLLPSAIKYVLEVFRAGGLSVADKINYDSKKKILILKGYNNMICRKSGLPEFSAGLVSGFLSYLMGKNIEAESKCKKCPESCLIIANEKLGLKHIPNLNQLKSLSHYTAFDILNTIDKKELNSFSDLLRFKKIKIGESGQYFADKMILPLESEILSLVVDYFNKINQLSLLKKGLIDGAEKLSKDIFLEQDNTKNKIKFLQNILSGLGWGISYFKKDNRKIVFNMKFGPKNKSSLIYQSFVVNGLLNQIFNKKFRYSKIKVYSPNNYEVVYS